MSREVGRRRLVQACRPEKRNQWPGRAGGGGEDCLRSKRLSNIGRAVLENTGGARSTRAANKIHKLLHKRLLRRLGRGGAGILVATNLGVCSVELPTNPTPFLLTRTIFASH